MAGGSSRPDVIRSYKDLEVWQVAVATATAVYRTTSSFPREEQYGLTAQMRRAAVSVASNIAEGYGRDSTASYVQFLRIAQGSVKELETHVVIAQNVGFLAPGAAAELQVSFDSIGRMLRALVRSLESKA